MCRDEKARLSKECAEEIFKTQVEGAQDYRTDADLHVACEPDAKLICKDVKPGEGRVQDCLVRDALALHRFLASSRSPKNRIGPL